MGEEYVLSPVADAGIKEEGCLLGRRAESGPSPILHSKLQVALKVFSGCSYSRADAGMATSKLGTNEPACICTEPHVNSRPSELPRVKGASCCRGHRAQ